ncbi:MAG TPA: hypothetical protein VFB80_11145 [Pirellulaceae bacterium]|nr:hypothetical protein [Pirellulaceae bacterium]
MRMIPTAAILLLVAAAATAAETSVSGTFKGNGKDAKIAHVSVQRREPFSDKASLRLIFTEKDHTRDPKADWNASFGRYGSALVISLFEADGGIFGCEVSHAAHSKGTFSSIGKIEVADYKNEGGQITARLTTGGQEDTFGQTWEVDLKFSVPALPPEAKPARPLKIVKSEERGPVEPKSKPARAEKPAEGGPALNVRDLPLPEGASEVTYKKLVEMITYKCPSDVKTTATFLMEKLAAGGWDKSGPDLVTPASAIIARKRGGATLRLIITPSDDGSEVKLFTTGLAWDEK